MSAPHSQQGRPAAPIRTDYRKLVERDFLGQWDLQQPDGSYKRPVVVIDQVTRYVPRERRKTKVKDERGVPVRDEHGKEVYELERLKRLKITFVGQRKAWLAGPVSQQVLASLFGPIVQDWSGKRIALYFDPAVKMKGKTVGGIRVSPKSPDARAPTTEEQLDGQVDEDKANELAAAAEDENFGGDDEEASP